MDFLIITIGSVLLPVLFIGLAIQKIVRSMRRETHRASRYGDVAGRDQQAIEKTALAKLGLGTLNSDASIVASMGTKRAAPMTIDDHILRPTTGVRSISIVAAVAFGYLLIFGDIETYLGGSNLMPYVMAASVVYAVAFVQTYEVRYNRDRLIAPGRAFNRREQKWRDLERIQDNGHYLFVLTFADGSKLEVQKHLVGMADFLTFAQAQIAANTSADLTPKTTMRPGGSVFGSRKTFS